MRSNSSTGYPEPTKMKKMDEEKEDEEILAAALGLQEELAEFEMKSKF